MIILASPDGRGGGRPARFLAETRPDAELAARSNDGDCAGGSVPADAVDPVDGCAEDRFPRWLSRPKATEHVVPWCGERRRTRRRRGRPELDAAVLSPAGEDAARAAREAQNRPVMAEASRDRDGPAPGGAGSASTSARLYVHERDVAIDKAPDDSRRVSRGEEEGRSLRKEVVAVPDVLMFWGLRIQPMS